MITISFVIPAHNEAASLPATIAAIRASVTSATPDYEIVVVDDASTDATAAVATRLGARVEHVTFRHIAATRNAGARAARGEIIFFIDADTQINAIMLKRALVAIESGAVGGGGVPSFDQPLPFWFHIGYPVFVSLIYLLKQPGGSSLFCTRKAYLATGGFNEKYYAAEDAIFVAALKKQGRFILAGKVLTSGRKARTYSVWHFIGLLLKIAIRGPKSLRRRQGLEVWYDSKREQP